MLELEEKWADAIVMSTSQSSPDSEDAATALVEPNEIMHRLGKKEILSDSDSYEYGVFIESDGENWAQWIRSILGPQWGSVADIVVEMGY